MVVGWGVGVVVGWGVGEHGRRCYVCAMEVCVASVVIATELFAGGNQELSVLSVTSAF